MIIVVIYKRFKQLWNLSLQKRLNGIQTHNLWENGTVLYQLNYQRLWFHLQNGIILSKVVLKHIVTSKNAPEV